MGALVLCPGGSERSRRSATRVVLSAEGWLSYTRRDASRACEGRARREGGRVALLSGEEGALRPALEPAEAVPGDRRDRPRSREEDRRRAPERGGGRPAESLCLSRLRLWRGSAAAGGSLAGPCANTSASERADMTSGYARRLT